MILDSEYCAVLKTMVYNLNRTHISVAPEFLDSNLFIDVFKLSPRSILFDTMKIFCYLYMLEKTNETKYTHTVRTILSK